MRVLFDVNTPQKLRSSLHYDEVRTAQEQGWHALANGELLRIAEAAGFDVMITADQNFAYQQNLTARRIALVVLTTNTWSVVRQHAETIAAAVDKVTAGSYTLVEIPRP